MATDLARLLSDCGGWGLSAILIVGIVYLWRSYRALNKDLLTTIMTYDQRLSEVKSALATLITALNFLSQSIEQISHKINHQQYRR